MMFKSASDDVEVMLKRASLEAHVIPDSALRQADGDLKALVRHPVEMAAIEPKTRKLTLLSRRLWMFMVSYSISEDATSTDVGLIWRVPLVTLEKDIGYNSNDKNVLKDSIRECQRTLVEWASSARDGETKEVRPWSSTQLLGGVDFVIDVNGRHCVEWSFTPTLLRQLRNHKHYFESSLQVAVALSRHSSAALYWVVSRYRTNTGGLTERRPWRAWIPILTGESDEHAEASAKLRAAKKGAASHEKYGEWRYFNRDVVAQAVKELNTVLNDIWVEAVPIKIGGKVEELQFRIVQRTDYARPSAMLTKKVSAEEVKAIDAMTAIGLTKKFATELCLEHTAERCLRIALAVTARFNDRSQSAIKNQPGFFVSQLGADAAIAAAAAQEAAGASKKQPKQSVTELADESLADYRQYMTSQEREGWASHPSEVRDDYLRRFELDHVQSSPSFVKTEFAKRGIKSPMVAGRFYSWLAEDIAGESWTPSDRTLLAFERQHRARR